MLASRVYTATFVTSWRAVLAANRAWWLLPRCVHLFTTAAPFDLCRLMQLAILKPHSLRLLQIFIPLLFSALMIRAGVPLRKVKLQTAKRYHWLAISSWRTDFKE